jgi:hypothetical protein
VSPGVAADCGLESEATHPTAQAARIAAAREYSETNLTGSREVDENGIPVIERSAALHASVLGSCFSELLSHAGVAAPKPAARPVAHAQKKL